MPPKTSQKQHLDQAFQSLLSLYGIHANIANTLSEIAREAGPVTPGDLQAIGTKLAMEVTIHPSDWANVFSAAAPVMVLLDDGQHAFLYIPGKNEAELAVFENDFAGHIIRVKIESKKTANTGHMWIPHAIDWFWEPIASFWKNYTEIILCSVFTNIFIMAMPLFTMNVYDKVVPNFAESTLTVLVIGIVMALMFDFILKSMRGYILEHVASKVGTKFDCDLMEQFFRIPALATNMSVGEKSNIFRELQTIRDFYASKLAPAMVDLPFFLMFLSVIAIISPILSVITLGGAMVIIVSNILVQNLIKRLTKKDFQDMQAKSATLVEMLSGLNTIRMFDVASSQLYRWKMITERSSHSSAKSQFIISVASNFSLMVMYVVNVLIVLLGVYEIHDGKLTVGGLVAATILSSRAIGPIMNVASVASRYKHSKDVLKTIDGLFKISTRLEKTRLSSIKGPFNGQIELRDVSFAYAGQKMRALDHVSLVIRPGEHVGLIGQTGAGKSTLARMITGYMAPKSGAVLLDGYAINTIHPRELRRAIGEVPQKPHFFRGSIKDNILLGDNEISEEDLENSPLIENLMEFIRKTGQGYDTLVGEDGSKLSGGQQQAVSMARALVRDPSILVFDEPTTGMDHALEMRVRDGLKEYLHGRTFIMVTHRTTLLPLVDRLILMDRGKIIADGPRDEIIKRLSVQG